MDARDKMQIEWECEKLSVAYARYVDYKQYDAFSDLFTEKGHLNAGAPLEGRENIRAGLAKRSDTLRSRHVLTNIHIDVIDANTATGLSYLTLYRHIGEESMAPAAIEFDGPAAVGHYSDRFERTDQGWRFASRVLELTFKNSAKF